MCVCVCVCVCVCTDCQNVEFIQNKSLTRLTTLRLVFFLTILNLHHDRLQNTIFFLNIIFFIFFFLKTYEIKKKIK